MATQNKRSTVTALLPGLSDKIYVTPQGEMGHNSLETQNELWVPNDAAWDYLPNAFYRIRLP